MVSIKQSFFKVPQFPRFYTLQFFKLVLPAMILHLFPKSLFFASIQRIDSEKKRQVQCTTSIECIYSRKQVAYMVNDCEFTIEFEENFQIPFHDILVKRNQHNFST